MTTRTLVRHEGHTPRERGTCGWRDRLISREIRSTELYYVLDGTGTVSLDRVSHKVSKGSSPISRPASYTGPKAVCAVNRCSEV
jgi:mannose-6-phosphate isomerase-like protein (cupin superfamily)